MHSISDIIITIKDTEEFSINEFKRRIKHVVWQQQRSYFKVEEEEEIMGWKEEHGTNVL